MNWDELRKSKYTVRVMVHLLDKDDNIIGHSNQQVVGPLGLMSRSAKAMGKLTGEVIGTLVNDEYDRTQYGLDEAEELPE